MHSREQIPQALAELPNCPISDIPLPSCQIAELPDCPPPDPPQVPARASRLRSIDCLRGIAALAVVLAHAAGSAGTASQTPAWSAAIYTVLHDGRLGVPLFFVISGFCIHLPWVRRFAESGQIRVSFAAFWKRRLHRLYPPYLIILCISMGMLALAFLRNPGTPLMARYPQATGEWLVLDFVAHVFMIHGFFPYFDQGGGNGVYWTLAREEYLYLMYFALLAWRMRWGAPVAVAITLVLGIAFQFVMGFFVSTHSPWWWIIQSSAISLWIQWSLGMLAVEAYYGQVTLPRWCYNLPLGMVAFAGALWLEHHGTLWSSAAFGLAFFILLNWCVDRERRGAWRSVGLVGWLSAVGIFSYSLYLVHALPMLFLMKVVSPFGANPLIYVLNMVLLSTAAYWTGKLFFHLVERRFLNTRPT